MKFALLQEQFEQSKLDAFRRRRRGLSLVQPVDNQRRLLKWGSQGDEDSEVIIPPYREEGWVKVEQSTRDLVESENSVKTGSNTLTKLTAELMAENVQLWRSVLRLAMARDQVSKCLNEMHIQTGFKDWDPACLISNSNPSESTSAEDPQGHENDLLGAPARIQMGPPTDERLSSPFANILQRFRGAMAKESETDQEYTSTELADGLADMARGMEEAVYLVESELEDVIIACDQDFKNLTESEEKLMRLEVEVAKAQNDRDDAIAKAEADTQVKKALAERQKLLQMRLDAFGAMHKSTARSDNEIQHS